MNKIYQQNLFGGEDEVITQIPVYTWQHKATKKYSNGRGLTDDFEQAILIWHKEHRVMTEEEIDKSCLGPAHDIDVYELEVVWLSVGAFNELVSKRGGEKFKGVMI